MSKRCTCSGRDFGCRAKHKNEEQRSRGPVCSRKAVTSIGVDIHLCEICADRYERTVKQKYPEIFWVIDRNRQTGG